MLCRAILASCWLLIGTPAFAQSAGDFLTGQVSPVLTLNQDGLYINSAFGKRVQAELEAISKDLAAENREIEAALVDEEQRLTEKRPDMVPEEFRKVAEEFDERVTGIRQAQEEKANEIRRDADTERARFFELAFPVLLELVEETGAVAILSDTAVIFSVRQIDITREAIERVDKVIGASPRPVDPGPPPLPRPDVEFPKPAEE